MITTALTGSAGLQRKVKTLRRIDVAENAGSPAIAKVLLRDVDQNGAILCHINIAASESKHITFDPPLRFPSGLYVHVSSGTIRGSVTGE